MAEEKPPPGMGDGVGELPVKVANDHSNSDIQEDNSEIPIKTEEEILDDGKEKKESQGSIGDFAVCFYYP